MSAVSVLPRELISKISAGEVIERPSSVVKELIENSIDAGSRQISIDIAGAGQQLIMIEDDGSGMDRIDVEMCALRHATSKIRDLADLNKIFSFGFRGEALYSISAVSRFRMLSSVKNAMMGTEVYWEGGEKKFVKDCAPIGGTRIEIKDLFYNTPVRLKYLKSSRAEMHSILDVVTCQAIAFPEIAFRLREAGTIHMDLVPRDNLILRITDIYGDFIMDHMIPIHFSEKGLSIKGYVSKPVFSRADRSMQFFFVNQRGIKSLTLQYGIAIAYRTRLMVNRYPVCFLFVDIDPALIDVNVHPTKKEIRFLDSDYVQSVVRHTIESALDCFKNPVTKAQSITPQLGSSNKNLDLNIQENEPAYEADQKTVFSSIITQGHTIDKQTVTFEESILPNWSGPVRVLGSICRLFIVVETEKGLGIIDQHAAHERILYEKIWKSIKNGSLVQQDLLIPIEFVPSPQEKLVLINCLEILKGLGFTIDAFGQNSFVLNSIPDFLNAADIRRVLSDILKELVEDKIPDSLEEHRKEKVARAACRRAVMANDTLSLEEMEKLVSDLYACDIPQSCPHGRPVFLEWTKENLEKLFGRLGSFFCSGH